MEFRRSVRRKSHINLTSLIDVIFLLIVFFMLTSKFSVSEVINLDLSGMENSDTASSGTSILIELEKDNKFKLLGEVYSMESLDLKLQDLLKENNKRDIVLMSRYGVTVQEVVTAMERIKFAGGENISLVQWGI